MSPLGNRQPHATQSRRDCHRLEAPSRGDDRRAEHLCRQLLAAQPDEPELHFLFGAIAHTLGRSEEAAASFRRAIELKPDYPEAHNNLGNALAALSQFAEAEACYRRALALKAAYPEAHNNLGNVLRRLKRDEEAAASFQRALELRPNYPQAHSNLGNTLRELGRLDESAASFRRALALKPEYPEAHNNLGIVYAAQGKRAEAIAEFEQAVHQRPKYSDALGNLGTVRDLAIRDAQTGVTTVANHRVFDSFGNLKSETNAAVDCLFGFTGRPLDEGSGTYRTATRPYDPRTGRWLQPDWIGFKGGDTNLSRHVGNSPTNLTDPTGLAPAFGDLAGALQSIAKSEAAKAEAARIAAAIQYTWRNNFALYPPITFSGIPQTRWGYFCYEWAYGFEEAGNHEAGSGKYFKVEVYCASAADGRLHAWVKITSKETGQSIYVDDGFWDGKYVHSKPPYGGEYNSLRQGCDIPRDKCTPPDAYNFKDRGLHPRPFGFGPPGFPQG